MVFDQNFKFIHNTKIIIAHLILILEAIQLHLILEIIARWFHLWINLKCRSQVWFSENKSLSIFVHFEFQLDWLSRVWFSKNKRLSTFVFEFQMTDINTMNLFWFGLYPHHSVYEFSFFIFWNTCIKFFLSVCMVFISLIIDSINSCKYLILHYRIRPVVLKFESLANPRIYKFTLTPHCTNYSA